MTHVKWMMTGGNPHDLGNPHLLAKPSCTLWLCQKFAIENCRFIVDLAIKHRDFSMISHSYVSLPEGIVISIINHSYWNYNPIYLYSRG